MRKLVWFTLGFGAACALSFAIQIPWFAPLFLLIPIAAFVLLGQSFRPGRGMALLLLGVLCGALWNRAYDEFYLSVLEKMDGQTAQATIEVGAYPTVTQYGITAEGQIRLEGKTYLVMLYLDDTELQLKPGDSVTGSFGFRYTGIQAAKSNLYQSARGVQLVAYQDEEVEVTICESVPLRHYPQVLRLRLLNIMDATFPSDTAGFAKALLLGEREGIDYATDTAFSVSGISHIIAVSGLHVSILFALIYFITGRRRFLTVLLGIPVLIFFAALAGFSPSITRACIMHSLMMVALLIDREYDGPVALSFAALVMMVANPAVLFSTSFQLSFGCMAGIFLFGQRLQTWMSDAFPMAKTGSLANRLRRWLISGTSVTLGAISLTTPLVAYHFGVVSLIGVVTNLLTLWVVTFIFYGTMLVCLLGYFVPAVAAAAAWIVAWPIRYILGISKILSSLPLAAVYTESIYIVIWLVTTYLMLAVFLMIRRKKPAVFAACVTVGLCGALLASWLEPMTDDCRVTALDVGQGQCILLQAEGKTYMVDCGGDFGSTAADKVASTLLSQGISRLDGIIVTHYDEDHTGGIPLLLSRIRADMIFLPTSPDLDGAADAIEAAATGKLLYVDEDMVITFGEAKLTIFGPLSGQTSNESSMCVLFQAADCDILITGDRSDFGERMLLREVQLPKLEVLVAGHHGSDSSTGEELLGATRPEIVLICAGKNNRFGHPHPNVLARLERHGCRVYRTDTMGTLTFRR